LSDVDWGDVAVGGLVKSLTGLILITMIVTTKVHSVL